MTGNAKVELTRLCAAWLASIAFGVTFLVASLAGVDGLTTLWRAVIAAGLAWLAAHLLAPPVVDVMLTALARDAARRGAEQPKEDA